MEIIRGLYNIQPKHRDNVITIGNFDGVHLGHQAIIKQLKKQAQLHHVPATLITFQPNPQEYFAGNNAPEKLMPFRDKMQLLRKYGIDRVVCIPFNQRIADLSANDFVEQILVKGLRVKHLVIGDDFQFGKNRQGNFSSLLDSGKKFGFDVESTPTHTISDIRVSSTRIRQILTKGDLDKVRELLGHSYFMSGKVCHGDKRGRTIGFPTANIRLKQQIAPINGVYAVKITGLSEPYKGVANLGIRPTIGDNLYLLEIYLFDFNQDIYGKRINVHFEHYIRPEQKFDGLDSLVSQIKKDTITAKNLLTSTIANAT